MISSILLVTPPKHNVVASARFFTEYGVSQVHAKNFDAALSETVPIADMLVILDEDDNERDFSPLKKIYSERSLPVLESDVAHERQMHTDFIKISFGDSLDVLRKPSVRRASKVLFLISRFFNSPKGFDTKNLRAKYQQLTGSAMESPLASSYCKSFCRQGYLTQKNAHTYCFKGLDSGAERKLKDAGFDVFDTAPSPSVAVPPIEIVSAPGRAPVPTPTPTVPVKQETMKYLHEEFAQLRREFADQLQLAVERISKMQNINNRLLHLKPDDVSKVESYLEFVALSKGNSL